MSPEERLKQLGIVLPEAPPPLGSYIPIVRTGSLLFLSGILPLINGKLLRQGCVGKEISLDEARDDAKTATVNAISILKSHIGRLDKVKQCVRITGYIASASQFTEQPKVLNAASDLLVEIFGEIGRHTRSAIGVNILPLNAPLEIDFIFGV